MGRFLSGGSGSAPRKQTVRLLASNPSVAIPSWARVAYITGCGGGAGGNSSGGSGAAAAANRFPLLLAPGAATMGVTIGAGGAGGGSGAVGGDTIITVDGVNALRLTGGAVGNAESSPALWLASASAWRPWVPFPQSTGTIDTVMTYALSRGSFGAAGSGGSSTFGAGGNGGPAQGYGAGGGLNGAGSPGFLLIDFEEAA